MGWMTRKHIACFEPSTYMDELHTKKEDIPTYDAKQRDEKNGL